MKMYMLRFEAKLDHNVV